MDPLKQASKHIHFGPVMIFFIMTLAFLALVVTVVKQGAGTTQSKASRDTFLTPGDDALSLQEDLSSLERDFTIEDEATFNAIE